MSYTLAAGLQAAVYARLAGNPELGDLVGSRIYDAPIEIADGDEAPEHVTLGEEEVRPWNTKTSEGAIHDFDVTVHSARDGFTAAKRIAGTICAALVDAPLAVEGGHLVALRFLRAKAERGRAPEKRSIALRFRAVIERTDQMLG